MNNVSHNVKNIISLLQNETDRGSVLVITAIIDETLSKLLQARFCPPYNSKDRLFDNFGPMNNLSTKVELAYRLGIVREKLVKSIHLLRKIRNDFAHHVEINDFNSESTKNRVIDIFKLNPEIMDSIVDVVNDSGPDSTFKDYNDLIKTTGTRALFEILLSGIASGLIDTVKEVKQLEVLK